MTRPTRTRSTKRPFLHLGHLWIVAALALFAGGIWWTERQERERWEEEEAKAAAMAMKRGRMLATASFAEVWDRCRHDWRESLSYYGTPEGIAWTRRGLDAWVLYGNDVRSLLHLRCNAAGVSRGTRVERPLLESLPVEAIAEAPTVDDEAWGAAISRLASEPRDSLVQAIEVFRHPVTATTWIRRWRGVEGAVAPVVEPADAPLFPLLVAVPELLPMPAEAVVPRLRALRPRDWANEPEAAFDHIRDALPPGARISEIGLAGEGIDLQIEAPTPAFDGAPPARWGEKDFDEFGVADLDWWYPREDPGFGCRDGAELDAVETAFFAARAARGGKLYRAWWSCSPAYGGGSTGSWSLVTSP